MQIRCRVDEARNALTFGASPLLANLAFAEAARAGDVYPRGSDKPDIFDIGLIDNIGPGVPHLVGQGDERDDNNFPPMDN